MSEPDIRFSLANERTFLAWQRTALGLVAAGLAVIHLLDEDRGLLWLGVLMLLVGAVSAGLGYLRFRTADRAIREGRALPTSPALPVLAAALAVGALVAAALALA